MQQLAVRWTQAQPTIASFITSLIPDFHDSEDVLQRVAAAVVDKYDEYDPSRPFVAWALGIARIEVLRFRSEGRRDRHVFDDEALDQIAIAYEKVIPDLEEMKKALSQCSRQLRGRARQLLELHYVRGLTPTRIAQQLGLTANAVFVALHRVRVALRKCIESRLAAERAGLLAVSRHHPFFNPMARCCCHRVSPEVVKN